MKKKIKLLFILFTVALLFLTGCKKTPVMPNELIVGSYEGEGDSLILLAEIKGIFKKNGVTVKIANYKAGKYAIEDVLKGKIDIATPSDTAFVAASFDHPELRIIANLGYLDIQKFLVSKEAQINNPSDLNGKTIGITKGTSSEFALYNYITLNKIKEKDFAVLDLTPVQIISYIDTKKIDGFILWEPYIFNAKKELKTELLEIVNWKSPEISTLLVTKETITQRKSKEFEAFIFSLKEAEDYLNKNNDEAKLIIRDRIKANDDYINYAWNNLHVSLELSQGLIFVLEDIAKWRINKKLTDKKTMPNYLNYFDFQYLEKVKPDSITIIR